ncbi:hypothetical protein Tsubulata_039035 [Turnera subulata]|uniref:Pentacotripeptide-repeat region of PRORP domain-containing protein n=1 Tax=Turnera subulata TaxID=218843 RepID=A0A9Q0FG97_9ROSI|nr:hypothetical protein Tsubulata_039035 [Turnera subulata]
MDQFEAHFIGADLEGAEAVAAQFFLLRRSLAFSMASCYYKTRYHSPLIRFQTPPYPPFSTHSSKPPSVTNNSTPPPPNQIETLNPNPLDEAHVLDQLSHLLPTPRSRKTTTPPLVCNGQQQVESNTAAVVVDRFLAPQEKLRGVFLLKLKGKSAIERALTEAGVGLSLEVVARVLNTGNLGGESMVTFFHWAVKQPSVPKDIDSYNVVIRALGRRKFIDFVMEMLHELKRECLRPNLETFSIVVDSLVRAGRVKKAIQMFGNAQEFGFESDAKSLNLLLQCLCKRSHVGAAHSYFNTVRGKMVFDDNATYNVVIGGWSKLGRVCEMESVLEAMVEDGYSPDCTTFRYVLEGLGRAGRMEDAVKIFEKMKADGCVPNTDVYNAMISNYVSAGDFDECSEYYRNMLSNGCHPNIDTYNKLISAFIKARKVADALEMFDEMLRQGVVPTTGIVTSFIEPLCGFGPPHAAIMIYEKAREMGCQISHSAYKLLLMRLSRFGKCGMLLRIWDEMHESGYSSDTEVYELKMLDAMTMLEDFGVLMVGIFKQFLIANAKCSTPQSNVALECILQSHPNMVICGEEVAASKLNLFDLTQQICDAVQARAGQVSPDKNHGVILLPEGLIESIPEVYALLKEIHGLLRQGVVPENISSQLSPWPSALFEFLPPFIRIQIETEKLLAHLVQAEMNKRLDIAFWLDWVNISRNGLQILNKEGPYKGKKFNAIWHFLVTKLVDPCHRSLIVTMPMYDI